MSKKNKPDNNGYVYSTDPAFQFQQDNGYTAETLAPPKQPLRIVLDTKQRAGKTVTLVKGFVGTEADLETLGRQLKTVCGTGGAVKDAMIIIQGDQRDKIFQWLTKNGYSSAKKM